MCYATQAALKKIGKLNEVTDVLEKSPFKSSDGFKLSTPLWKYTLTHTLQRKDMTYQAMRDFFFLPRLQKGP